MPHENKAEEAVEAAEAVKDALEQVDEEADTLRPPGKFEKLKAVGSFLTHIVALVTAAGALMKTFDHSVTKSAYDALSSDIAKLSDQAQKNHDDLMTLHGYLDGLAHTPASSLGVPPAGGPPPAAGGPPTSPAVTIVPKRRPPTPAPSAAPELTAAITSATYSSDGGVVALTIEAPPVPDIHPPAAPVKPLSFDQAIK